MVEHESIEKLSYADRKIIDQICDEFESEYLAGKNPDIKKYAADLPESLTQPGLVELVALDAYYGPFKNAPSTHENASQSTNDCNAAREQKLAVHNLWQNYVTIFPTLAEIPIPNEFQTAIDNGSTIDGRFKSRRRHASGGLGRISIATDMQFNRNVAIKEIRSAYRDNPAYQQRFIREAEITGQLEHPGVVPVYVLGHNENDEPYYAMRFIDGQSMLQSIHDMHRLQDQSSLTRVRRQLLNRLIDVCNTVEYVHNQSVIHRDIKPQNIMLGEFGETLLVDWGLAKRLRDSDEPSSNAAVYLHEQSQTQSGTILGTAGYMSPEQATGDVAAVNSQSDIYSLGATLFQLLTGKVPPALTTNKNESEWYRQLNSTLDSVCPAKPLNAICCKAMSLAIDERYQSARALAVDIELAIANEPVSVYQDSIWTRTWRWIQRHPAFTTATLVTVFLTFVGLSIFAWLSNAYMLDLRAKNDQLDKLVEQETQLRLAAQSSEKRTTSALGLMSDALRSPDPNKKGRDVRVIDQLASAVTKLDAEHSDDPLLQARVLNEIGFTYYGLSEFKESAQLLERAHALYLEHVGGDDFRTLTAGKNLGNAWLRLNDERAYQLLDDVALKADAAFGHNDPLTLNFQRTRAMAWIDKGKIRPAISMLEKMLPLYRDIYGESSRELASLKGSLSKAYAADGRHLKAANLTRLIHEQRVQQEGKRSLSAITAGYNHVKFLRKTNKRNDVIPFLESLLSDARKGLGNDHFQTIMLIKELGQAYLLRADRERGIPLIEDAWKRISQMYGEEHALSISTANSLGFAYLAQGNYFDAAVQFRFTHERALRIYGPDHSETLTLANNLAMAYQLNEQFDPALDLLETTHASQTKVLGRGHPKTILTLLNWAGALRDSGSYSDAVSTCHEVVELAEALETDHYYSQVAMLIEGTAWLRLEDYEAAEKAITKCHESRIRTAPRHWQRFLTMSVLGEAMMGNGDFSAAEPLLLEGYKQLVQLESRIPERAKSKIRESKDRVARFYEATNQPEKAAPYRDQQSD